MISLRPFSDGDLAGVWKIFQAVVQTGDTYVFDPTITEAEAMGFWLKAGHQVFVAEINGELVGTYILRANQPGLGSHVANAAFMVGPKARGQGVGYAIGEHCVNEARSRGFRAIQFNFVVSTNQGAVRLWQRLGFAVIGTLPGAFRHQTFGYVDVYVMFREL